MLQQTKPPGQRSPFFSQINKAKLSPHRKNVMRITWNYMESQKRCNIKDKPFVQKQTK